EGPAITSKTPASAPSSGTPLSVPARTASEPSPRQHQLCTRDLRVTEQAFALIAAETAQTATFADVELFHDATRLHLPDTGKRFEHAHHFELRERFVARPLVEEIVEAHRPLLQLRLHLRALATRFRRLFERSLALLGGERRGQWHPATSGTTAA